MLIKNECCCVVDTEPDTMFHLPEENAFIGMIRIRLHLYMWMHMEFSSEDDRLSDLFTNISFQFLHGSILLAELEWLGKVTDLF